MKRRFGWIVVTVIACLGLVAGAFAVGRFVRSPNEEAIANSKNKPVVTAKVEERSVPAEEIRLTGKLSLGRSWNVTVEPSNDAVAVVTQTYLGAGDTLNSGGALASVAGRPVIGLQLPFDLYRDISGGDSGDDVREIQRALKNLGLYNGAVDGEYGPRTANAVKQMYVRAGMTPPDPVPQETADGGGTAGGTAGGSSAAGGTAAGGAPASSADSPAGGSGEASSTPTPRATASPAASLTPVIRSEIISLPAASVTVVSVAGVNTHLSSDQPLAQLRSGQASVVVRVGVGDKDSFTSGSFVDVQAASDTTIVASGTVGGFSEFTQDQSASGSTVPGYDMTINVADPKGMGNEQDVVVRVGGGEATSGLAVPVTALREEGGETFVVMKGTNEQVPVKVKIVSDGYAIIDDGALNKDDEIIVSGS
ncbi:MAG: hypothetical protein E7Z96_10665 [Actinomycetaceae bacterium]|nr:hypothetical protein [Actinomycetaceae bacterium]